jgi:hypothetical protein
MVYDAAPPYSVRQTAAVDAACLQGFARFARYWDMLANSGRFRQSLQLLLNGNEGAATNIVHSPFHAFLAFSDWLWQGSGKTNCLSPEALVDVLFDYLCKACGRPAEEVRPALLADYVASGARGSPQALRGHLPKRAPATGQRRQLVQRQAQHRVG